MDSKIKNKKAEIKFTDILRVKYRCTIFKNLTLKQLQW